jgi:hypothetical protein
MRPDYYEVLGCSHNSTAKQIKSAYHALISKFHPDRNPDPAAAEFTARLNEAYSVVGDERQRSLYDAWLKSVQEQAEVGSRQTATSRPEVPPVKCAKCGRQDETIRLALMYYAISVIFITYRRGASGMWCERCRAFEAAKWSIVSGLLGWWGVPWGPIYTIHALFVNAKGGSQPNSQNAALLRVLGYQLYQQGRASDAFAALTESLKLEPNADASQLHEYLRYQSRPHGEERRRLLWTLAAAAPSLLVAALFSYGVYRVATEPSGYEANYQPPSAMPDKPVPAGSASAGEVNDLVDQLATIVESRSPVTGTHNEGTTVVTDHELDRSKFDEAQLYPIAESIGAKLHSGQPDSNGLIASAYFNARLFALSVDVANRLDRGQPIDSQVNGVVQLGSDPLVSRWLLNSRFESNYSTLCHQLKSYSLQYRPGLQTTELDQEVERDDQQRKDIDRKLSEYKSSGDIDSYNALVPEYNSLTKRRNGIVHEERIRSIAGRKLDLAFNRCLDPAILTSKFQQVDLQSHAAEVDSLADPSAADSPTNGK